MPTSGEVLSAIPVIALTGHLGAGKTTLLNHLLRSPGTRIGVVVNDFGELNVDAALVAGQIDEPASIAGGCICCLPDKGGLDDALARLSDPARRLDAIIVEASGLADPVSLARIIGFSALSGIRSGGLVDVVDAINHFDTVDRNELPPARYGAASLVVVNKLDQVPEDERPLVVKRVKQRVAQRNPRVHVVGTTGGRIDPTLLFDAVETSEVPGQLSFRELLLDSNHTPDHVHADAVTVTGSGCVDLDALCELLEQPPPGGIPTQGCGRYTPRPVSPTLCRQCGGRCHPRWAGAAAGSGELPGGDRDAPRGRCRARASGRGTAACHRAGVSAGATAAAALPAAQLLNALRRCALIRQRAVRMPCVRADSASRPSISQWLPRAWPNAPGPSRRIDVIGAAT